MTMWTRHLTVGFSEPYITRSSARTAVVPPNAPFSVSIAGRGYPVDTEFKPYLRDAFRHRSIPAQREAIDLTNEPGVGTVNVEDLWRREVFDWTLGAGQNYLDRKASSPSRFWQSKGIETALPWQATLLPKAKRIFETLNTTVKVLCVGDTLYIYNNGTVTYTTDLVTFHTVTGRPTAGTGVAMYDWATNGHTIWMAWGAGGIYATTVGASTMTAYCAGTITTVGWAGTYLLASHANILYGGGGGQAITGPTLPTPLWTHPNPAWVWTHYAWSDSEVYIAGHVAVSGGTGAIFRTTTTTTGATLEVPVLALPLEGGELPTALFAYLNFVFLGTNLGVRMCRTVAAYDPSGNAGDLEAGAIQPNLFQKVKAPVTAICANNRFVYFAWQSFDATSSGLGRLDLSNFVDELTPAYVSDLMVPDLGAITGADWFYSPSGTYSTPVLAMSGSGVWVNDPVEKETSGYIASGYVTYGIPDDKVALQLSARAQTPLDGTVAGFLSVDQPLGQNFSPVGTNYPTRPQQPWKLNQVRGGQYQVRLELTSPGTGKTPTLQRWLLKSYPGVVAGIQIVVPIILARRIEDQSLMRPFDPYAEYAFLENLRQTQQVIKYVEGPFSATCVITSMDWIPYQQQGNAADWRGYNGDLVVYLKTFATTAA